MLGIYILTIFTSAALLFVVQPMVGKGLLPLLGGSPGVWTTCMLFFQTTLLAGYAYAHLISTRLRMPTQLAVHAVMLGAGVVATWLWLGRATGDPSESDPIVWLLTRLTLGIGPGFFVIASAGPLLQRWFSRTSHRTAADPYYLYAASNAGSLLGLVGYPFLVEPQATLPTQREAWTAALTGFALLACVCGAIALRPGKQRQTTPARSDSSDSRIDWKRRGKWVFFAFVPSSLLLSVTTYISTDVAAVPLLWVIPLAIYLISFIVAFGRLGPWCARSLRIPASIGIAIAAVIQLAAVKSGILFTVGVSLSALAVISTYAHARLAQDRPDARGLTGFFLLLSLGGAIGGVFNGIVAPLVFHSTMEYGLTLVAASLVLPFGADAMGSGTRVLAQRYGLPLLLAVYSIVVYALFFQEIREQGAGVFLLAMAIVPAVVAFIASKRGVTLMLCILVIVGSGEAAKFILSDRVILRDRTFFGTLRVEERYVDPETTDLTYHVLLHGTTLHGVQLQPEIPSTRPEGWDDETYQARIDASRYMRSLPTSYYHPTGPLGDMIEALRTARGGPLRIGVIGLGAGSVAGYGMTGDEITFFEIDPEVIRIAQDPGLFSYLSDSPAEIRVVQGDGRLKIAEVPDDAYDLIVLDAFSSDAIPAHLLTVEALAMYTEKLRPGGYIASHLSNRLLRLHKVITPASRELGLIPAVRYDAELTPRDIFELKNPSIWFVIAQQPSDLEPLALTNPGWGLLGLEDEAEPWTDNYSNILSVIDWGSLLPRDGE